MASDSPSHAHAHDKIAEGLAAEELVEKVNIHGKFPDDGGSFGDAVERNRRERALLRKQDLIIMPLMALSYMFSYLVGYRSFGSLYALLTFWPGSSTNWKCPHYGTAKVLEDRQFAVLQLLDDLL